MVTATKILSIILIRTGTLFGITYDDLETIKSKYSSQFLKYARIVGVNQD